MSGHGSVEAHEVTETILDGSEYIVGRSLDLRVTMVMTQP
jgi:hypothetical protein